jgi:hypothetical protein
MFDGGAPAQWTSLGMRENPESFFALAQLAGWDYAALVTPDGPTPERVAAQQRGGRQQVAPPFCRWLPPSLRYLFAPCVGAAIGGRVVEEAEGEIGQAIGPLLILGLVVLIAVLVFK